MDDDPIIVKKAASGGGRINDIFAAGNQDIVTSVLRTSIDDLFVSTSSKLQTQSIDPTKKESIDDMNINYQGLAVSGVLGKQIGNESEIHLNTV